MNKVPLLGDMPLIGPLFRSTSVSEDKTELLIVMTVDVVRNDAEVHEMSIAQRDKYIDSRPLHKNPLLEGLRILPDESLMGPIDVESPKTLPPQGEPMVPKKREEFGPKAKPKTYGPVISRPLQTTETERPVYGPKIVRVDELATP